jgi:multidrug resistance efflux pump
VDRSRAPQPAPEPVPVLKPDASTSQLHTPFIRGHYTLRLVPWAKRLATLTSLMVAVAMILVIWDYYATAPWTRDGRVRVQVARVAPQVSGRIIEVRTADNQFVHKGDVLYVIDPFDYEIAVQSSKALVEQRAADLQVKQAQSDRRQHLSSIAASAEEQQIFAGTAIQAQAAFKSSQQQLAQAEVNLQRTEVRTPVNGYVTNLLMRVGDFAHEGATNVSVTDSDSYWIDGYFEETKMARICIGDRVEAKLMGYARPITGHVATVTRGIGVSNAAAGVQGLPNVDPVYTWVRLAQRVPVRIAIDTVPPGIPLIAGMTVTVTVLESGLNRHSVSKSLAETIQKRLSAIFNGPPARVGCIPASTFVHAPVQSLSIEQQAPALSPSQINPGLKPSMNESPRSR